VKLQESSQQHKKCEEYLCEIFQDYWKHHKLFQQCLREIARKFATAQKMRG
jgi:hypothetical protein